MRFFRYVRFRHVAILAVYSTTTPKLVVWYNLKKNERKRNNQHKRKVATGKVISTTLIYLHSLARIEAELTGTTRCIWIFGYSFHLSKNCSSILLLVFFSLFLFMLLLFWLFQIFILYLFININALSNNFPIRLFLSSSFSLLDFVIVSLNLNLYYKSLLFKSCYLLIQLEWWLLGQLNSRILALSIILLLYSRK